MAPPKLVSGDSKLEDNTTPLLSAGLPEEESKSNGINVSTELKADTLYYPEYSITQLSISDSPSFSSTMNSALLPENAEHFLLDEFKPVVLPVTPPVLNRMDDYKSTDRKVGGTTDKDQHTLTGWYEHRDTGIRKLFKQKKKNGKVQHANNMREVFASMLMRAIDPEKAHTIANNDFAFAPFSDGDDSLQPLPDEVGNDVFVSSEAMGSVVVPQDAKGEEKNVIQVDGEVKEDVDALYDFHQLYMQYREQHPRDKMIFDYRVKLSSGVPTDEEVLRKPTIPTAKKTSKAFLYVRTAIRDGESTSTIEYAIESKDVKGQVDRFIITPENLGDDYQFVLDVLTGKKPNNRHPILSNREVLNNIIAKAAKQNRHSFLCYDEVYNKLYKSPCLDLWQDAYLAYNFAPQFDTLRTKESFLEKIYNRLFSKKQPPHLIVIPDERPKAVETFNSFPILDVIKSGRYLGLPAVVSKRNFVKDRDGHLANYLVAAIPGDLHKKNTSAIDFDWALADLDEELHFLEYYLPIIHGPTNHETEVPRTILICDELAETEKKISQFPLPNLNKVIDDYIAKLEMYYGLAPTIELAQSVNAPPLKNKDKKDIVAVRQNLRDHLSEKFQARQKKSKKLYLEVKISLSFIKREDRFEYDTSCIKTVKDVATGAFNPFSRLNELRTLIEENPQFFITHFNDQDSKLTTWGEGQQREDDNDDINFMVRMLTQSLYGFTPGGPDTFALDPTKELINRSGSIFHHIFNGGKVSRFASENSGIKYFFKTMLGFPNKSNKYYNTPEFFLSGFGIVTFIKNTVKLATEYLPAIVADGFAQIFKKSREYLRKPSPSRTKVGTALSYTGLIVGGSFYGVFKAVQLLAMRVTSPIRSFVQAYRFGLKHSKPAGVASAVISGAVSIVGITLASIAFAPVLALAVGGLATTTAGAVIVYGLNAVAKAIMAIPVIGPALSYIGSKAALNIVPALAAVYAALITPLRSIFKKLVKNVTHQKEVNVVEPIVGSHDEIPSGREGKRKTLAPINTQLSNQTRPHSPGSPFSPGSPTDEASLSTETPENTGNAKSAVNIQNDHTITVQSPFGLATKDIITILPSAQYKTNCAPSTGTNAGPKLTSYGAESKHGQANNIFVHSNNGTRPSTEPVSDQGQVHQF